MADSCIAILGTTREKKIPPTQFLNGRKFNLPVDSPNLRLFRLTPSAQVRFALERRTTFWSERIPPNTPSEKIAAILRV